MDYRGVLGSRGNSERAEVKHPSDYNLMRGAEVSMPEPTLKKELTVENKMRLPECSSWPLH